MSTDTKPAPRPVRRAAAPAPSATVEDWLAHVQHQLAGVRYGSLQIVVHDGRIMQVESTERIRLQPPAPAA